MLKKHAGVGGEGQPKPRLRRYSLLTTLVFSIASVMCLIFLFNLLSEHTPLARGPRGESGGAAIPVVEKTGLWGLEGTL